MKNNTLVDTWDVRTTDPEQAMSLAKDMDRKTTVLKINSCNLDFASWSQTAKDANPGDVRYVRFSMNDLGAFEKGYQRPPMLTFSQSLFGEELYKENVTSTQLIACQNKDKAVPTMFAFSDSALRTLLQQTNLGGNCTQATPFFRNMLLADDIYKKEVTLSLIVRSEDGECGKCFAVLSGKHSHISMTWHLEASDAVLKSTEYTFDNFYMSNKMVVTEYTAKPTADGLVPFVRICDSDVADSMFIVTAGYKYNGGEILRFTSSQRHSKASSAATYAEDVRKAYEFMQKDEFIAFLEASENKPADRSIYDLALEIYEKSLLKKETWTKIESAAQEIPCETLKDEILGVIAVQRQSEVSFTKDTMLKATLGIEKYMV